MCKINLLVTTSVIYCLCFSSFWTFRYKRVCVCAHACSVVSHSLWHHWQHPTRLLCPWNFPGNNTGVIYHFLLQRIFPTQELNPSSCIDKWILYQEATGKPIYIYIYIERERERNATVLNLSLLGTPEVIFYPFSSTPIIHLLTQSTYSISVYWMNAWCPFK